jgi:uncharacterized membrane protein
MDLSWLPAFSALLTPIIVVIGWWVRRRESNTLARGWRSNAVLVGLIASSLNTVVFYAWIVWWNVLERQASAEYAKGRDFASVDSIGIVRDTLGNYIALPLVCIALISAIPGKGRTRAVVAASAITGFLMWVPVAFL